MKNIKECVKAGINKVLQEVGDEWGTKGIKSPEDIERYGAWLGAENFILQGANRTNYELRTMHIKDILAEDKKAAERIAADLDRVYNTKNLELPIIINKQGKVIDGYHRLKTKLKFNHITILAYVGM